VARSRILKPGFFLNEQLAALSFQARLCFAGLWLLADREGRLVDRPRRIKAELFPYDALELEPIIAALSDAGFIQRYIVNDTAYIAIPKFTDHQNPHVRETKSLLPAPDKAQPRHSLGTTKAMPRLPVIDPVSVTDSVSDSVKNKNKLVSSNGNGNGHALDPFLTGENEEPGVKRRFATIVRSASIRTARGKRRALR